MSNPESFEVQVFKRDNPNEMIAKIPFATEKKFLDELDGPGGGSFVVHKDDLHVKKNPTLLDPRNVVKVVDKGKTTGAFLISKRSPVEIDSRERQSQEETIAGEGLTSWFQDAEVHSPAGNTGHSYDSRSFNFASPRGSWYNANDWMTPVKLQQKSFTNTKYRWGTAPAEWPDAPGAWFVWNQGYGPLPNLETAYFRYEFTTSATAKYKLFAAADDEYTIYVDGQEIYNGQYHYETSTNEFELQPGNHVIGFRVMNNSTATNNPAALIASFFQWGDAEEGTAATMITQTGDSGWQVSKPGRNPGWAPGEIVSTLFEEALDRGVLFPTYLNYSFTDTHDSKGVLWETPTDMSFQLGEKYDRVMEQMYEQGIEYWIDPDTYTLHMAPTRGKSKGSETVKLRKGHSLKKAESAEETVIRNQIRVKTKDGWITLSNEASKAKYGTVEETLEIDAPSYKAERVAQQILDQYSDPERTYDYEIIPVRGSMPWVDFEVGDWILSDVGEGEETHRVMSISVEENSENGEPEYSIELDSIFRDREERLSRTLEKLTNGSLGGSLQTTGTVGRLVSAPGNILAKMAPEAPQNLEGVSQSQWVDSITAQAVITLEWQPVEETIDGNPANLRGYNVYTRYNVPNAPWNLVAETEATSSILTGFRAGDLLQFQVRAISHGGAESAASNTVTISTTKPLEFIPAPTTPEVTSEIGLIIVKWDGNVTSDPVGPPPGHLDHVYAEIATSPEGPFAPIGQPMVTAGGSLIGEQPVGEVRYIRLGLIDKLGTQSPKSEVVEVTVVGVDWDNLTEEARQQIEEATVDLAARVEAAETAIEDAEVELADLSTNLGTFDERITTATTDAADAKQDALAAHTAATGAATTAGEAKTAADNAATAAATAQSTAEAAQDVADTAAADLLTLAGKTGRVIRSATSPTGDDQNINNLWLDTDTGQLHQWDGSDWELITDSRITAAANAADEAANLAGTAQAKAETAESLANAAQAQADTATTAAGNAQAAATAAQGSATAAASAASTADGKAVAAQSAADAASSAAASAAGVAAGKADVLIQPTAPAAAMRKATTLWIDTTGGLNTPKRWTSGTTWVAVTDKAAVDAANAAAAAQGTANTALTNAGLAKDAADAAAAAALLAQSKADTANQKATTADGRYTVAAANPVVGDGSGKPTGAVWEVRSGGTMLRKFVWSGTAWTQVQAGSDQILDDAITAAKVATGAIGTDALAGTVKTSISNAQTAANNAQTAANTAKGIADTATADLLTLSGRTGRVIRDTSGPTGTDRNANNLWLNTTTGQLNEWTGSAWAVITDSRLTAAASAADTANNLAGTAQSRADAAHTLATTAKTQADTATTAADNAQASATAAQGTANSAAAAASTADGKAVTAQSAAAAAASAAATASGIATAKSDVLIQSTAPVAAMRKASTLWIDTTSGNNIPKRWTTGTTWVAVTDKVATDAAAAAVAAQGTANTAVTNAAAAKTAADNAAAAALAAQGTADTANQKATTADGRITVAAANPTTANAAGKPIGAIWEVRSGGITLRRYVLTAATTWTQVKAGQDFIGDKAIGRAQIADLAVGTAQIADAQITTAKIGLLAVGAAQIANLAVGTAEIANGAIVNAKIGDAAIKRANIQDGEIVRAKIGDAAIGTAQVADAAITNAKIGDLSVGKLTVTGGATFPTAVMDTLIADNAFVNRLTAERIVVSGQTENMIPNGAGELGGLGGVWQNLDWDSTDKPDGLPGSFSGAKGAGNYITPTYWFDADPTQEYLWEGWIKADVPNSRIYIELRNQLGEHGGNNVRGPGTATQNAGPGAFLLSSQLIPTEWTYYSTVIKPNPESTRLRLATIYRNHSLGTERDAKLWFAGFRIRPRNSGELIVDGSIQARHVEAESVAAATGVFIDGMMENLTTTGVANMNTATVNELYTKMAVVEKLQVTDNLVTKDMIATGAVTAEKITVNQALANDVIAAGDIWSGGTVTGKTLQGGVVTTGTPGISNRTYMDSNGLTVVRGGTDQVKIGHGYDNGMAVRNPGNGVMTEVSPMLFGATIITWTYDGGNGLRLPQPSTTSATWSTTSYTAPSNRVLIFWHFQVYMDIDYGSGSLSNVLSYRQVGNTGSANAISRLIRYQSGGAVNTHTIVETATTIPGAVYQFQPKWYLAKGTGSTNAAAHINYVMTVTLLPA